MSEFNESSFSSPQFEIDSIETPSIRAGGPSNSNILNRYFRSLQEDLVRLGGELSSLQIQQKYLTETLLAQAAAYSVPWAIATVMTSAMAITGNIIWIDGHSTDFLVGTAGVDFDHKTKYGQWTLPIRSEFDLLFTHDIYGEPWVSSEASLRYLEAATDGSIEDIDMVSAINATSLLSNLGVWLNPEGEEYKWIQLDAPLQYQSLPATCVEFDPMPCYGTSLCKVQVLANTWTDLDLSYTTGWDGTEVANCGPVRLFFDDSDVRAVRILLRAPNTAWGLGSLRLKHLEFMPTGTLIWEFPVDPSARVINLVRIGGKDPVDLNELTQMKEDGRFTLYLTSDDIKVSPVITNTIVKFII